MTKQANTQPTGDYHPTTSTSTDTTSVTYWPPDPEPQKVDVHIHIHDERQEPAVEPEPEPVEPEEPSLDGDEGLDEPDEDAEKRWRIVSEEGKFCVYKLDAAGKPSERLKCYPSREQARRYQQALYVHMPEAERSYPDYEVNGLSDGILKAVWTTAFINDLPDSCFLYISPGGSKDGQGKTVPRSLRHFPYKDSSGKLDLPHLRNAIARIPQANIPAAMKPRLQARARALLARATGGKEKSAEGLEDAETLVVLGTEIKALGEGRVGGYLVAFTDQDNPDLEGEFFDAKTDFDFKDGERTSLYFNHGLDPTVGRKTIGEGTLEMDEFGVWVEGQLEMRDRYEEWIYSRIEEGKMGWSSGVPSHLVEKESTGKARHILRWPLRTDASITPTPAEPKNVVLPLKALADTEWQWPDGDSDKETEPTGEAAKASGDVSEATTDMSPDTTEEGHKENDTMTDLIQDLDYEKLATLVAGKILEAEPPKKHVEFAQPKQEEPTFKLFGEFLQAVYKASLPGGVVDPRLKAPSGMSEGVPSDGGFLVQTDFAAGLLQNTWETGVLAPRCRRQAISANSNRLVVNALDETSRVTGSRYGGIRVYWVNEADTATASRPKFRQMELQLHKLLAFLYATDELLQDAAALQSLVMQVFPDEMNFVIDDAIIRGTGAGQPLGILNSPSLITVNKESGQAAGTIVAENIIQMYARMWPRSKPRAIWLINADIEPALMTMYIPTGTSGQLMYMPPGGLTQAPYGTLLGRPVIPIEQCETLGTVGDIMFVDLSQYIYMDKGNIDPASSLHVRFLYDEMTFRWTYRAEGQPSWSSAITPYKGTNTLSPFVVLQSRT